MAKFDGLSGKDQLPMNAIPSFKKTAAASLASLLALLPAASASAAPLGRAVRAAGPAPRAARAAGAAPLASAALLRVSPRAMARPALSAAAALPAAAPAQSPDADRPRARRSPAAGDQAVLEFPISRTRRPGTSAPDAAGAQVVQLFEAPSAQLQGAAKADADDRRRAFDGDLARRSQPAGDGEGGVFGALASAARRVGLLPAPAPRSQAVASEDGLYRMYNDGAGTVVEDLTGVSPRRLIAVQPGETLVSMPYSRDGGDVYTGVRSGDRWVVRRTDARGASHDVPVESFTGFFVDGEGRIHTVGQGGVTEYDGQGGAVASRGLPEDRISVIDIRPNGDVGVYGHDTGEVYYYPSGADAPLRRFPLAGVVNASASQDGRTWIFNLGDRVLVYDVDALAADGRVSAVSIDVAGNRVDSPVAGNELLALNHADGSVSVRDHAGNVLRVLRGKAVLFKQDGSLLMSDGSSVASENPAVAETREEAVAAQAPAVAAPSQPGDPGAPNDPNAKGPRKPNLLENLRSRLPAWLGGTKGKGASEAAPAEKPVPEPAFIVEDEAADGEARPGQAQDHAARSPDADSPPAVTDEDAFNAADAAGHQIGQAVEAPPAPAPAAPSASQVKPRPGIFVQAWNRIFGGAAARAAGEAPASAVRKYSFHQRAYEVLQAKLFNFHWTNVAVPLAWIALAVAFGAVDFAVIKAAIVNMYLHSVGTVPAEAQFAVYMVSLQSLASMWIAHEAMSSQHSKVRRAITISLAVLAMAGLAYMGGMFSADLVQGAASAATAAPAATPDALSGLSGLAGDGAAPAAAAAAPAASGAEGMGVTGQAYQWFFDAVSVIFFNNRVIAFPFVGSIYMMASMWVGGLLLHRALHRSQILEKQLEARGRSMDKLTDRYPGLPEQAAAAALARDASRAAAAAAARAARTAGRP